MLTGGEFQLTFRGKKEKKLIDDLDIKNCFPDRWSSQQNGSRRRNYWFLCSFHVTRSFMWLFDTRSETSALNVTVSDQSIILTDIIHIECSLCRFFLLANQGQNRYSH